MALRTGVSGHGSQDTVLRTGVSGHGSLDMGLRTGVQGCLLVLVSVVSSLTVFVSCLTSVFSGDNILSLGDCPSSSVPTPRGGPGCRRDHKHHSVETEVWDKTSEGLKVGQVKLGQETCLHHTSGTKVWNVMCARRKPSKTINPVRCREHRDTLAVNISAICCSAL